MLLISPCVLQISLHVVDALIESLYLFVILLLLLFLNFLLLLDFRPEIILFSLYTYKIFIIYSFSSSSSSALGLVEEPAVVAGEA